MGSRRLCLLPSDTSEKGQPMICLSERIQNQRPQPKVYQRQKQDPQLKPVKNRPTDHATSPVLRLFTVLAVVAGSTATRYALRGRVISFISPTLNLCHRRDLRYRKVNRNILFESSDRLLVL